MKFQKLLEKKHLSPFTEKAPTIAFLGDSVTQGCFEVYLDFNGKIQAVCDPFNGYAMNLVKRLYEVYPMCPINIIYGGISGDNATNGLKRLDTDILAFHPDLTIVSYGLNDCSRSPEKLEQYLSSLRQIFEKLQNAGSEVIYLTENMMNTKPCDTFKEPLFRDLSRSFMELQNDGTLTEYFEKGKQVAKEMGVTVCDGHKIWLDLYQNGTDTDQMLANRLNHPSREAVHLFSNALFETIMK